MMYDDIKHFEKQFEYKPKVENAGKLGRYDKFLLCGMGGSHLAADLLKCYKPDLDIIIWKNYGLPPLPARELKERLIIASSYSGNTEETISALEAARARGLAVAVIAAGGKLIELAKKYKLPHVAMPDMHMQPRLALGFSAIGISALMGSRALLRDLAALSGELHPARIEAAGKALAKKLKGSVPLIYASDANRAVAENFKIVLDETGKIPAFWNVLPELNHNEMTGFDVRPKTHPLSRRFHFVLLRDADDHPRIKERMRILESLLRARKFKTEAVELRERSRLARIFGAISLAHWTAFYAAKQYGVEAEQVPMVEEFKRLMK